MILIYKNVIVRSEETPNYITEQFVFVISTPTLWESVHDRLLSSHTQKWEFLDIKSNHLDIYDWKIEK